MYKKDINLFRILELRTQYRACRCCRHAARKKIITESLFTIGAKLIFLMQKKKRYVRFGQGVRSRAQYPIISWLIKIKLF